LETVRQDNFAINSKIWTWLKCVLVYLFIFLK
jgi:hypothetical protein